MATENRPTPLSTEAARTRPDPHPGPHPRSALPHLREGNGKARRPFVTLSRQAGAGAITLGEELVEQLNRQQRSGPPWELYDHRLVEQVSREHDLPREWVDLLEERDFSWLTELFAGLDFKAQTETNEFTVYRRVSESIRRLARRGHVVIVGRGAAYITADMRQAVHIRLVAPLEDRILQMARRYNLSHDDATERVEREDANRQAFYQRYWPDRSLGPHNFTLTINTSTLDEPTMVKMLNPLIEVRSRQVAPDMMA